MKVEKIKIEKELLDVYPSPIYRERNVLSYDKPLSLKDGEMPEIITENVEEIIYELRKVFDGFGKKVRLYYVKINDRKIFNDLIEIRNSDIEKIHSKGVLEGKEETFLICKTFFLNLPWYKRLFNKYFVDSIKKEIQEIKYGKN